MSKTTSEITNTSSGSRFRRAEWSRWAVAPGARVTGGGRGSVLGGGRAAERAPRRAAQLGPTRLVCRVRGEVRGCASHGCRAPWARRARS